LERGEPPRFSNPALITRIPVAEDADLTMALLQNGYRVEYEDLSLAFTEAPVNANGLMRQRFRWSFGILQAVWKHGARSRVKAHWAG
jgi:cellulose synthase/poly-beta-1,6-N-acetylglucosamine synthase-like glycosyltransferase